MSDVIPRFMGSYEPVTESGCWIWMKSLKNGYGQTSLRGKNIRAHRLAYMLFKGVIPEGMVVCHSCDVRCCVNPDHLWLGTIHDNNTDMMKKNRFVNHQTFKTSCPKGHPYTNDNVFICQGGRICRTCKNARNLKGWHRLQAAKKKTTP